MKSMFIMGFCQRGNGGESRSNILAVVTVVFTDAYKDLYFRCTIYVSSLGIFRTGGDK